VSGRLREWSEGEGRNRVGRRQWDQRWDLTRVWWEWK